MLDGWEERVGKDSTNILKSKGIEYGFNTGRFIPAIMRGLDKVKHHIPGGEQLNPLI